jgi:RNA polymerase primary sigma factor
MIYANEDESLAHYLKEIAKTPLLTAEETFELGKRKSEGDKKARELLIKSNLRYVVAVAKKYQGNGLPLMDLIAEGNIGLINAVEKYDADKGFRFTTHALWWIKQAMLRELQKTAKTIKFPAITYTFLYNVRRLEKEGLSIKEIAEKMNKPIGKIEYLLNLSETISLDSYINDEKNSTLEEVLEDERLIPIEEPILDERNLTSIIKEELTEKEARVITLRFGFEGEKEYTFREIGEKLAISYEGARLICGRALKKLAENL